MRQYYPDPNILPDSIFVAKTLILSARLYNAFYSGKLADIPDTYHSLLFYAEQLGCRINAGPPKERNDEYNRPFAVSAVLTAKDISALILHKALRLHAIWHATTTIHNDSVADILGYLKMLAETGVPRGAAS